MSSKAQPDESVAIVGMACRLPGAPDLDAFWDLLREGRHGVTDVSALGDWDRERVRDLGHAALLNDIAEFDAPFFRISPREADYMDPQQRLLLELAWHALEDSGIVPSALRRSAAGVYIGISGSGYALQSAASPGQRDAVQLTGALCSIAANRLSYFLGVHGPSLAVDTACSSSLVAIHLACEGLARGDTDLALAGGVSLLLDSLSSASLAEAGVLSPDGRCKTFDASANGYVRGEGAAMLVLRPLAAAQCDGDRIYAVIRGSAVNQDGPSNGLMAPNGRAQEMVLGQAYQRAGVEPSRVDYVEAHGTGTLLGDPIEAKALGRTVGRGRPPEAPCRVGSSKTNVGHLESAAGVTGVVKCCLMMHHRSFVPSLGFHNANPYIPFERLNLAVQTRFEPWETNNGESQVAGVSSFGIGGTNAHIVLESVAAEPATGPPATALQPLLALAAETPTALRQLCTRYASLLEQTDESELGALCNAAATQREALPYRAAIVAESTEEVQRALSEWNAEARPASRSGLRIAFLFTGQGSQYTGMGSELFDREPLFRQSVQRCAEVLDRELDRPLLEVMFGTDSATLDETVYSQPAIFALEYGLAQLWKAWGITPAAVLGHSVGEIVAACVAGALDLDAALRLVALRGRVMQESSAEGSMLAVEMSEERALALLEEVAPEVEVAAVNSPLQTVFTGRSTSLDRLDERLREIGVSGKRLPVRRAFHSALLDPVLPKLERGIRDLACTSPSVPFFSNVTGKRATEELSSPSYWLTQARSTVRFAECMAALAEEGYDALLEVGSTPVLLSLARGCLGPDTKGFASLRPGTSDSRRMVSTLGGLFELGATPDWSQFFGAPTRRVSTLPRYPFQRRPYWLKGEATKPRALVEPISAATAPEALPTPSDPAHAIVVARLAAITGHLASELSLETQVRGLGLSSIGLVELVLALGEDVPALEEQELDWAEVSTVGDIVETLRPHLSAEGATAVGLAANESTVGPGQEGAPIEILVAPTGVLQLRRDPRNRVLEQIVNNDGKLEARIVVDQTHPFYFDHPYDHVPGLLFVEAVQQLSEWLAMALGGESLRRRLQLEELRIRFESWGDLDTPLKITSEGLTRESERWRVRGSIGGSQRCATFEGLMRPVDLVGGHERMPGPQRAASRRLVHKQRSENVLISEPVVSDEGVAATALLPTPEHALRDSDVDHVSATQLVEWTRQFLTARAHALEHESFDSHFILLAVHIRLAEVIGADDPVTLWSPTIRSIDTSTMRLSGSHVELRSGDLKLGGIELYGAAADTPEYQRARWGEV